MLVLFVLRVSCTLTLHWLWVLGFLLFLSPYIITLKEKYLTSGTAKKSDGQCDSERY